MANAGVQLLGFTLAFLGLIGTIASTILVEWKASSHAGDNIITAQALYEGLWKTCAWQSTGQIQCKVYDSLLQLPGKVSPVSPTGARGHNKSKDALQVEITIDVVSAGLFALVGTSWYGHRVAQDFYNPFTPTNSRYEFGTALYVGWGSACLCLIGGGFLCCNCSGNSSSGKTMHYTSAGAAGDRNYV
ncbi:PREDICTED: claudin-1-like [Cyprinodon variegatus]|uniref:claudin-1-like n=1 Tax=Cyprinodon variegatus TaxID=28743 RepID=UPI0007427887|nr:PREDICTED: claudin-1-like [Cyprinodon variegatus]